jgi:plasmid stabilization system protein ParE
MAEGYRIIIRPEASENLDEIFAYIHNESPQNTTAVAVRLVDAIDSLNSFPRRHKVHASSREAARVGRSISVPPHLIYYRVMES